MTLHGTYRGHLAHLKGETALLQFLPTGELVAQFDSFGFTKSGDPPYDGEDFLHNTDLAYGWHQFPSDDFEIQA